MTNRAFTNHAENFLQYLKSFMFLLFFPYIWNLNKEIHGVLVLITLVGNQFNKEGAFSNQQYLTAILNISYIFHNYHLFSFFYHLHNCFPTYFNLVTVREPYLEGGAY